MNDHYQVKWDDGGVTRYGIVYDNKADKGALTIEDAVLPVAYQLPEVQLVDIPSVFGRYDWKTGKMEGADEYQTFVNDELLKAEALAQTVKGVAPGALFALPVGDGCAYYLITEVKGSRAKMEWRGFSQDRWRDHHFGLGGWYGKQELEPYVLRTQATGALFGKKAT